MQQQVRLALAVRPYAAWMQGDRKALDAAISALHTALDLREPAARALVAELGAMARADQPNLDPQTLQLMASRGMVQFAEWVGCDVETFNQALWAALSRKS
jgi:hypothetical protein